jgi:AraC family transcriptional regulator
VGESGRIEKLTSSAAVLKIIEKYMKIAKFVERREESKDEIDEIIDYVKKNYADGFTLEELAERAALSPNYFAKKFKERTGFPPLKYINILRIEKAKFLLEHSETPISSLMEEVGFLDAAHFSKLFKMITGYSPRRYRASFDK